MTWGLLTHSTVPRPAAFCPTKLFSGSRHRAIHITWSLTGLHGPIHVRHTLCGTCGFVSTSWCVPLVETVHKKYRCSLPELGRAGRGTREGANGSSISAFSLSEGRETLDKYRTPACSFLSFPVAPRLHGGPAAVERARLAAHAAALRTATESLAPARLAQLRRHLAAADPMLPLPAPSDVGGALRFILPEGARAMSEQAAPKEADRAEVPARREESKGGGKPAAQEAGMSSREGRGGKGRRRRESPGIRAAGGRASERAADPPCWILSSTLDVIQVCFFVCCVCACLCYNRTSNTFLPGTPVSTATAHPGSLQHEPARTSTPAGGHPPNARFMRQFHRALTDRHPGATSPTALSESAASCCTCAAAATDGWAPAPATCGRGRAHTRSCRRRHRRPRGVPCDWGLTCPIRVCVMERTLVVMSVLTRREKRVECIARLRTLSLRVRSESSRKRKPQPRRKAKLRSKCPPLGHLVQLYAPVALSFSLSLSKDASSSDVGVVLCLLHRPLKPTPPPPPSSVHATAPPPRPMPPLRAREAQPPHSQTVAMAPVAVTTMI